MHERDLLLACLAIDDPQKRTSYLDQMCAGDSGLRSRIETLLKSLEDAERFPNQPLASNLVPTIWLECRRRPAVASLAACVLLSVIGGTVAVIAAQAKANFILRDRIEKLEKANTVVQAVFEADAEAIRLPPTQLQRLEENIAREKRDRVPIFDPIPKENRPGVCLDEPTEAEMWAKVPKARFASSFSCETERKNARYLIEKIGEKVDPPKVYPLAGACQLAHCHFKCTVYFDEVYWSDKPIPFRQVERRIEVVYIDKDYLRRYGGPPTATILP